MICDEEIDNLIKTFKLLNDKYKNYNININKYNFFQNNLKILIDNHIFVINNLSNNLYNIEEIVLNLKYIKDLNNKDKFLYIFNETKNIIENMIIMDFQINKHNKILENMKIVE